MVRVYANLIVAGRRVFSSVLLQDQVKEELQRRVTDGEITQEEYEYFISL